jgi:MFS family permease
MSNRGRTAFALSVLFAINAMNFYDRNIIGAVGETIRKEWHLSDTALGSLGTAFTLLYAAVGLPLGRLADNHVRKRILAAGVFFWSLFTAGTGIARNFSQMFAIRLGVGVGEASCAPAGTSLIGDLYPASKRAKALAVFMLGLPIGIAFSSYITGWLTEHFNNNWRPAFFVAGIPGLICVVAALFITEPARGASEVHNIGGSKRPGSSFYLVLTTPTMWWLIISGALHNFNMYAIGSFLIPFLIRYYRVDLRDAGLRQAIVYGLAGVPGLLIGGYLGDHLSKRFKNGRLVVGTIAVAISAPLVFLSLMEPPGHVLAFTVLVGVGIGSMYVYYSTVYSAVQDVVEPSLRGTAMAIYFFAMYVLGASLGPLATGFASDYFTKRAATAAGITVFSTEALEPFKGQGLHSAMFIIPILIALLAVVLYAGSRTITKDMDKLHDWMRDAVPVASKEPNVIGVNAVE